MTLGALERWFDSRVAGPWEGRRPRGPAPREVVLPNARMTADERLAIYTRMYYARLHEALEQDYPALRAILGEDVFDRVMRAYVAAHPSRSYTLNDLGRRLPRFLERARGVPSRRFVADVARVERTMSEVFDAEEAAPLTPGAIAAVPPDAWAGARVVFVPAFRLLALSTRANAAVTAARQGLPLPERGARRAWVAVYRRDYRVLRMDLTRPQFALLSSLARGRTVRAALAAAARAAGGGGAEALPAQVFGWFRDWTAEGLFRSVRTQSASRSSRTRRTKSSS